MAEDNNYSRFANLNFDQFRKMAKESGLSQYEKIGFPDEYRKGKEEAIFQDLLQKLSNLKDLNRIVLDVGPGCSDLPKMLIQNALNLKQKIVLVDSEEMLSQLPERIEIEKVPAYYPRCPDLFKNYLGKVDAIIVYSVLQYIFVEGNIWEFLDKSLSLLAPGGQMLIGDIPNISKRKRFFNSETGKRFHKGFTKGNSDPVIDYNRIEENQIDDSVIFAILSRARGQGFNAYVLPQMELLPMANRREDILITRD